MIFFPFSDGLASDEPFLALLPSFEPPFSDKIPF